MWRTDRVRDIIPDVLSGVAGKSPDVQGVPVGVGDTAFNVYRGEFTAVLASSQMGSTAFLLTMAVHAAVRQDIPCLYFTMDLSREILVQRMLCLYGGISFPLSLGPDVLPLLTGAAGALSEGPVYIQDGTPELDQVEKIIRGVVTTNKVQLILIDTIDDVGGRYYADQRSLRGKREKVCARLRMLAASLNVGIVGVMRASRLAQEEGDIARFSDNVAHFYAGEASETREIEFIKQKGAVRLGRSRLAFDPRSLRCSFVGEEWR